MRRQCVQCSPAMTARALALTAALLAVAAARPECPPDEDCRFVGDTKGDFVYELDGGNSSVSVNWRAGAYLELVCRGAATLGARSVPRFQPALQFPRARVACTPPASGVGDALGALGAGGVRRLTLAPPRGAALSGVHLARLPGLQELRLEAPADGDVTLEDDALADLSDLQVLTLTRLASPTLSLQLPPTLRTLVLQRPRGGVHVPRAWASLRRLRVEGASTVTVNDTMTELQDLWVSAAALWLAGGSLAGARLQNVTLQAARALPADLLRAGAGGGGALRQLAVLGGEVTSLAPRWLAGMPALQLVTLSRLPLSALPASLLHASGNLTSLAVTRSRVSQLPPGLLKDAVHLAALDLSYNALEAIPESLFVSCPRLRSLDVSHNRLVSLSWAATLGGALSSLTAGYNPLGEACPGGVSPLAGLGGLVALRLSHASLPRVCRDWRLQLTRLEVLDLAYNNITDLDESLLHWVRVRGVSARAVLSHNPLNAVYYSEEDWRRANDSQPSTPAQWSLSLELSDTPLPCDCRVYWLLQAPPPAPATPGLCERERRSIQELSCESEPCAPDCTCLYKPSEPNVTHMTCTAVSDVLLAWPGPVSLRLLPAAAASSLPRMPLARRLLLAGNQIATLSPDDLPDHLQELDVSNNSITSLSAETVTSLLSASRRVWLARNPLACACAAEPLLRALHQHQHQIADYLSVSCSDGRLLAGVPPASLCSTPRGLAAGLAAGAALLLAGAAGAALLTRYRHLLKALLHARGLWPFTEDDGEGEYEYDAFVSYSHRDAEWVEETLVPRLEALGRRLCVHARDWRAGEWIASQMSRSVDVSRRTLAVLSPDYLAGRWPRAELRLALAASLRARRPRLVLLLMPGASTPLLQAEPELAAYIAANTYLRADDVAFWHKLALALPPARRAPPAPAPAPAAAAVAA